MTADTLVEARWVIPVIPRNTVLENHTVVFSGGRIADILPTEAARVRYAGLEAKTMRLPAGVVMPGLINLHTHAAMNLLRGRGADLPLMDWLTKEIWPAEGRLMSAEFVHDGSLIAGVEMIRSGVTCCSDLYFFPEAAAEGLREAGLRCATAGIVIGFPSAWAANDDEYISKCEALIERYSGDPFVRVTVGPHAPYTVSDASLARCAALSERHDLPVHIHVNETASRTTASAPSPALPASDFSTNASSPCTACTRATRTSACSPRHAHPSATVRPPTSNSPRASRPSRR